MSKLVVIKNVVNGDTETIGISTNIIYQQDKSTLVLGNEMITVQFESYDIIAIENEPE